MSEPIGMRGPVVPPTKCWQERGDSEIVLTGEDGQHYATIEIKNSDWLRRILAVRGHILAAVREREAQAAEIERLRAVLREARHIVREQHAMIVDCQSHLDPDGEPIPGTLEPEAEDDVAHLQFVLARIDAALSQPEGESND